MTVLNHSYGYRNAEHQRTGVQESRCEQHRPAISWSTSVRRRLATFQFAIRSPSLWHFQSTGYKLLESSQRKIAELLVLSFACLNYLFDEWISTKFGIEWDKMCRHSHISKAVREVLRNDLHLSSPSLRMQFIGAENVLQQTSQRAENAHVICSRLRIRRDNKTRGREGARIFTLMLLFFNSCFSSPCDVFKKGR
jgi:hypothetical protein